MNLNQTIYVKAFEAAQNAAPATSDHAAQSAQLAAFNNQGLDPLDYPHWVAIYSRTLAEMAQLKQMPAQSELAAKAAR